MADQDQTKPYRLTDWKPESGSDAIVCHLVYHEDLDNEGIIATFAECDLGVRLAEAALALANGDAAMTGDTPAETTTPTGLARIQATLDKIADALVPDVVPKPRWNV